MLQLVQLFLLLVAKTATSSVLALEEPSSTAQHLRHGQDERQLQNCAELPTNLYFQLLNHQTHLALHVADASQADGANVVYEFLDGGMHDTFRLVKSGIGNFYHLIAQHSNKVIAVSASSLEAGANIEQETLVDESNQDWCFIPTSGGYYRIENRNSGQIIMAEWEANTVNAGKNVFQWFYWGGLQQEWRPIFDTPAEPLDSRPAECLGFTQNTFVELVAQHSQLALAPEASGNIVTNNQKNTATDNWHMVPSGGGHVHVMNQVTGLALSLDEDMNLIQKAADDTSEWCFGSVEGEYYYIRNRKTGNSIDVQNYAGTPGSNVATWPWYGGANQHFRVQLADGVLGDIAPVAPTPAPTPPPNTNHLEPWIGPFGTPVVGVALSSLPNGKILMWSAFMRELFDYDTGSTWTALFDPSNNGLSELLVSNTEHDMFCPGVATMENGDMMITGGADSDKTTIYTYRNNKFKAGPKMKINRGYHSMTVLTDGRIFTAGGSWHGGIGGKHGEMFDPVDNAWGLLPGVQVDPLLTSDSGGVYRSDNHLWLFQSPVDNMIFHAGPSKQMNFIDASGTGSIIKSAVREGSDRMNGNALMLDIGIVFVTGGAPNYDVGAGTKNAYEIDINDPSNVKVTKVGSMKNQRTLSNSVVLPGGEVLVVGGQTTTLLFSDDNAVMKAELYNPKTKKFTELSDPMRVPRTYHSTAILMNDGRVMVAGGGLCGGCAATHNDFEILVPPYLFSSNGDYASRPKINSSPGTATAGATLSIQMSNGNDYTFEIIRTSAVTHAVNNDQRRIPLTVTSKSGNVSKVKIPGNPNVALLGTYYLFAISNGGVPSVAKSLQINYVPVVPTTAPVIAPTKAPVVAPTTAPIAAPTKAPVVTPTKAPVAAPTKAPVVAPTKAPVAAPTKAPVVAPTKVPVAAPTKAPVVAPTKAPVAAPTKAPVVAPTKAPVVAPTKAPVVAPTKAPIVAPTQAPVAAPTDAPTPLSLATGKWIETNANAPIDARHEACMTFVGKWTILVGGRGSKGTSLYNTVTKKWTTGAKAPIEFHHMQCVSAQNKLWVVAAWTGGFPEERNVDYTYVYDPLEDKWSTRSALPLERRRGAAAAVVSADEKRIYVSHGSSGGHETADHSVSLPYLDEYMIKTDTWKALSSDAPNPRDHCGGAIVGGRLCVAGGRVGSEVGWPDVGPTDCYDFRTKKWAVEASIPQKRAGSAYGTSCDGQLLVAGGEGNGQTYSNFDAFDGKTWTSLDGLNIARQGTGLAIDCLCNQIHVASGAGGSGGHQELKSIETFFLAGQETVCTESAPVRPNTPFPTRAPVQNPTPSPVTWAPALATSGTSPLKLIDVPTNEVIVDLYDGIVVDVKALGYPSGQINIQAVFGNDVQSVHFGETDRTETGLPYSFCGNNNGDFNFCTELPIDDGANTFTVTATPYTGKFGGGEALPEIKATYTVMY